ncbi:MAG: hypothetical protein AB1726_03685 [Planctomycetota bacterium]
MDVRRASLFAGLAFALAGCALVPPAPRTEFPFRPGERLAAGEEPIFVEVGHLVPSAVD